MLLIWLKRVILGLFLFLILLFVGRATYNYFVYGDLRGKNNIQELERAKEELRKLEQEKEKNWKEEIIKKTGLDNFSEFEENPDLLNKWLKKFGTYWQVKYWLDIGIKPDEYDFACWIYNIKSKQFSDFQTKINYQEPLWVKDNVNIEELRKEYLDSKN